MYTNDMQDFIVYSIGGFAIWLLGFIEGLKAGKRHGEDKDHSD